MNIVPDETPHAAGQDEAALTGTPDLADITYGVRWTASHNRKPTVIPCRDAATAASKARRVRALQRVFCNAADAAAVYRLGDGEWLILLPTYAEKLIAEFQEWLNRQPDAAPNDPPTT